MSQLSRFQVVREPKLMEYLAPVGNNPWDYVETTGLTFLRLPLFLLLVRATTALLRDISEERSEVFTRVALSRTTPPMEAHEQEG